MHEPAAAAVADVQRFARGAGRRGGSRLERGVEAVFVSVGHRFIALIDARAPAL
jgi:hypothetical protein